MKRSESSASYWIPVGRVKFPKNNHSVPKAGEYIEIILNKYLLHDRKTVQVSEGVYYVQEVTQWLVICTKVYNGCEVKESFQISDFKSGICLFSVIKELNNLNNLVTMMNKKVLAL